MSKKVDICDLCQTRYPQYHFRYKAFRWFHAFMDVFKERYDICDECWERLRKAANQKRKKA